MQDIRFIGTAVLEAVLEVELPFYKGDICITIALNRDGLETSGENVHNESLVLPIILGES